MSYRFGRDGLQAAVDGAAAGRTWCCTAPGPRPRRRARRMLVDLEVDGVRRVIDVTQAGGTSYVDSPLGHSVLTEADRFPDPAAAAHAGLAARADARAPSSGSRPPWATTSRRAP